MIKYLLQHLLEESAQKYPNKSAVSFEEKTVTYRELNEISNSLANMLIELGFQPRNVVGIYLNKSIEAAISMFAILKAGGAYIPLDSHYSPLSRIKKIIELSEAQFIISDSRQWTHIKENCLNDEKKLLAGLKVVLVDGLLNLNILRNEKSYYHRAPSLKLIREPEITDDDLAYVLYTSGSTGIPKGVMLTHLNALTFINWSLNYFKPTSEDVFSNFAPMHFDLSVFDIYVSIASGACLSIVPFQISGNPRALVKWIEKNRITFFYSVPSVWVSILNYATVNQGDFKNLKNILFAGEVFPPKYLKQLMGILQHGSFYNLYGPTETNVCTYYHVKSAEDIDDKPVPIGRVCQNTEILVLNEYDEPAGLGEEGELLVKGSIVTKGYYKDEERTEAVFRRSPLEHHYGSLFYKTGDIVRINGEGIYEYLGRKDLMVKCSGFRIELPEIEQALLSNESIEEAVVMPFSRGNETDVRVGAAVKMRGEKGFSVMKIKEFLAGILPKYMIPEIIIKVGDIPRNSNGKADRQKVAEMISNS